jgi:DNA-binding NtrC family response regulator
MESPTVDSETLTVVEPPPLPPTVDIEVLAGTSVVQRFTCSEGVARIGSSVPCELVIADPAVSGHHATVSLTHHGIRVVDVGSRNGTWYLGARVHDATIAPWGAVRVGQTFLRFCPRLVTNPSEQRSGGLLYASAAMQQLMWAVQRAAESDSPVLIVGETGVGKESIARLLHTGSRRKEAPMVVVDCGSLQGDLADGDLFGHSRGAFTGAQVERVGAIESSNKGTLLLDGIEEMHSALQPKLLRVLEHRQFSRLGENTLRSADFRLVATASVDLANLIEEKRFRQDLYHRIAVIVLRVPPLRERREDIAILADAFAAARGQRLTVAQRAELESRDWPGNVRQLKNEIERMSTGVALAPGNAPRVESRAPLSLSLRDALELKFLRELMARHQGNVTRASIEAQLSRSQMHRLLKKHGLVGLGKERRSERRPGLG